MKKNLLAKNEKKPLDEIIIDVGGRKLSCLDIEFEKKLLEAGISIKNYIALNPGIEVIIANLTSLEIELDDQNVSVAVFAKRRAFAQKILNEIGGDLELMAKFGLEVKDFEKLPNIHRENNIDISCDILTRIYKKIKQNDKQNDLFNSYIKEKVTQDTTDSWNDFEQRLKRLSLQDEKLRKLESNLREENTKNFVEIISGTKASVLHSLLEQDLATPKCTSPTTPNKSSRSISPNCI